MLVSAVSPNVFLQIFDARQQGCKDKEVFHDTAKLIHGYIATHKAINPLKFVPCIYVDDITVLLYSGLLVGLL